MGAGDQKIATRVIPSAIKKEANQARTVILSPRKSADAQATRRGLTPSKANNRFNSKKRIRCSQLKNQTDIEAIPTTYQPVRTGPWAIGLWSEPEPCFKKTSPVANANWESAIKAKVWR